MTPERRASRFVPQAWRCRIRQKQQIAPDQPCSVFDLAEKTGCRSSLCGASFGRRRVFAGKAGDHRVVASASWPAGIHLRP